MALPWRLFIFSWFPFRLRDVMVYKINTISGDPNPMGSKMHYVLRVGDGLNYLKSGTWLQSFFETSFMCKFWFLKVVCVIFRLSKFIFVMRLVRFYVSLIVIVSDWPFYERVMNGSSYLCLIVKILNNLLR